MPAKMGNGVVARDPLSVLCIKPSKLGTRLHLLHPCPSPLFFTNFILFPKFEEYICILNCVQPYSTWAAESTIVFPFSSQKREGDASTRLRHSNATPARRLPPPLDVPIALLRLR